MYKPRETRPIYSVMLDTDEEAALSPIVQALKRLRELFPDETCSVFTETWIDPRKPDEVRSGVNIKIGWPGKLMATGATLEQAMAEIWNPYEDQTCAECKYGAVDSIGLCVMDAAHKAVPEITS